MFLFLGILPHLFYFPFPVRLTLFSTCYLLPVPVPVPAPVPVPVSTHERESLVHHPAVPPWSPHHLSLSIPLAPSPHDLPFITPQLIYGKRVSAPMLIHNAVS